eukprot:1702343-Amphidinium_carterae.2
MASCKRIVPVEIPDKHTEPLTSASHPLGCEGIDLITNPNDGLIIPGCSQRLQHRQPPFPQSLERFRRLQNQIIYSYDLLRLCCET